MFLRDDNKNEIDIMIHFGVSAPPYDELGKKYINISNYLSLSLKTLLYIIYVYQLLLQLRIVRDLIPILVLDRILSPKTPKTL